MAVIIGNDNPETLIGTGDDDTIDGQGGDDFLHGLGGNDVIYGSFGSDHLFGEGGNDYLVGDDPSTTFNNDILDGGAGDDFLVIQGSDEVVEAIGGGYDNVLVESTSGALSPGAEIEVFSTTNHAGTGNVSLTGNEFGQIIIGNAGNNGLDGGGGNDSLVGLGGNDTYLVDAGDTIVEAVGAGSDIVSVISGSFTLNAGAEIEIVSVSNVNSLEAVTIVGNEFSQSVIGNAGANVLRGGGGVDALFGREGNDIYYVDVDDVVHEVAGGGVDTVLASESYGLVAGTRVEILATADAAGTAAINLFGNEFGQTITGNAGSNYLFGRGGGDTLIGLGGDDFLFVETGDVVTEAAGGGYDNVLAGSDYVLTAGAQVEVLSTANHADTGAIRLTGNELGQILIGNAGVNHLTGGGGADTLAGGGGDDFLFVDADDAVVEGAGGGYDNVLASASYTLTAGAQAEILSTTNHGGTAAIDLTGNELGQIVIGNAGNNVLNGGGGADALLGFGGTDSYAFTTALGGGNVDLIIGFDADDVIQLDDAVFSALGGPGPLNPNAFVIGTAAQDADDRIVYNSANGQLLYDADGNGAGTAVLFATLDGAPALTASDFAVI